MTKKELEEALKVGDTVKILTKNGEFAGRLESFGETAIKLLNPITGSPKGIVYDFIVGYDADLATSEDVINIGIDFESKMIKIPGTNYRMGMTAVTQRLYEKVMGENPSYFQLFNDELEDYERDSLEEEGNSDNNPVERVSWFDAIYFCNKLSLMEGLEPAYSVDGETDPAYWEYTPHQGESLDSDVYCDWSSDGYRLPTNEEWDEAAKGGENFKYSGSDDLDEVGWYEGNSNGISHSVAQKKANGYGLYDMSGNVSEWTWDIGPHGTEERFIRGGSFDRDAYSCEVGAKFVIFSNEIQPIDQGFRLLRPLK